MLMPWRIKCIIKMSEFDVKCCFVKKKKKKIVVLLIKISKLSYFYPVLHNWISPIIALISLSLAL